MRNASVSELLQMMDTKAHLVAINHVQTVIFGETFQPVCMDCDYVGPHTPEARAHAIAYEHRQKSLGTWEPAR